MVSSSVIARLSRISTLLLLATSAQASHIFLRQAPTCGGKPDLQQCGTGFPSDFCCPTGTSCMSLNSADVQSVICCPTGSDCGIIQTITCDVSQLNATQHPENQLHLSETDGVTLPTCGSTCCPLGYKCQSNMCFKETASPSSSPTTTLPTPSATNPASASQSSSCPAAPVQMDAGFNGSSFAAGFFPGLLIGALGTIGLMWAMKKRRESHNKERFSGDFGHVARQISDPIYDPQHAARTDFMRRGSRSAQPSPNSTADLVYNDKSNGQPVHGLTPRIKSMWDRTPKLNFGFNSGLPSNPAPPPPAIRAGNSQDPYTTPRHTPRRKHRSHRSTRSHHRPEAARTGSTETIDVLMPAPSFLEPPKAHGMRENRFTSDTTNTTFTKLMERAGFDDEGRKEVRNYSSPNPPRI
ncbi:hypothetical protein HBI17_031420 [Parastagonospora nodorum]|nr:hypothetical protein HBI51_033790 [Parastagonospora nodorum]KAH5766603.1 hypothetical protein HBI17_031420 [Parastagonospora nodorum]KAH6223230.1 hypothetical protein HBI53_069070 [Parastagonospora nodorum]